MSKRSQHTANGNNATSNTEAGFLSFAQLLLSTLNLLAGDKHMNAVHSIGNSLDQRRQKFLSFLDNGAQQTLASFLLLSESSFNNALVLFVTKSDFTLSRFHSEINHRDLRFHSENIAIVLDVICFIIKHSELFSFTCVFCKVDIS